MLLDIHEKQNLCEIFRPIEIVIFWKSNILSFHLYISPNVYMLRKFIHRFILLHQNPQTNGNLFSSILYNVDLSRNFPAHI